MDGGNAHLNTSMNPWADWGMFNEVDALGSRVNDAGTGAYLDVSLVQRVELVGTGCVQDFELKDDVLVRADKHFLRGKTHRIGCAIDLARAFVDLCQENHQPPIRQQTQVIDLRL